MAEKQETVDDIIAEMRIFKCRNLETGELELCNAIANYFADRLEAAHKREKAAIEADALAVGGIVEAARKRERGDYAKLREVVGDLLYMAERYVKKTPATESAIFDAKTRKEIRTINYYDVIAKARAALAATPRNCDRFASAEEAWDAYDKWVDSYRAQGKTEPYNEFGWLYALATERKGENDGK